jgi:acetylornithine/succinyldiaminopimelate/putrescine aminotransferase
LDRAAKIGERFKARFTALKEKCPLVQEVRVKGAMIGLQLAVEGAPIVQACLDRGLLINCTHSTVIRLLPAINLGDAEIDQGCDVIDYVLLNNKA